MSISAILAYGGQVTAIGLLIVFTGLFIIIGCIYLMSALFKMGGKAAENRARRKADEAREILLQKKSRQEYRTAQATLARALNRLRVKEHREL